MLRRDEMTISKESRGRGLDAEQVPERPALALDVELIGPMPETGFTDQQWLVRQGNRFLQFTELLYALLQEINGERTLDEMRSAVRSELSQRGGIRRYIDSLKKQTYVAIHLDAGAAEVAAKQKP